MLHPGVPIGVKRPYVEGTNALRARLRMVLETRPGRLPWRPDFGCDLEGLLGEPATPQNLNRARFHVEQAIGRWLPDLTILRLSVEVVPVDARAAAGSSPPGEGALVSLGTHGTLVIHVEIATPEGPVLLSTPVQP